MSIFSSLRTFLVVGALAGYLVACSPQNEETELYERIVEGNVFDTATVRGEFRPLRYRRSNFEYKCMECHRDVEQAKRPNTPKTEHTDVLARFDHGLNTVCLNCHDQTDRDVYVNHDGSPIPSNQPERLCAKCHGPIYRDWKQGIHGRQNGYWNKKKGPRTKLVCVQCHDPHSPKFPLMTPDPPPIRSRLDLKPETH